MSIRDRVNYIDKLESSQLSPDVIPTLFSVQYKGIPPDGKEGIVEIINKTDDFKRKFRSSYVRWALTINALNVSQKYYSEHSDKRLGVGFLRIENKEFEMKNLIIMEASKAKENTNRCLDVISAYGVFDLYGCFEEIIFDLYEIYLNFYPEKLISGKDHKDARVLFRKRNENDEDRLAWCEYLRGRIEKWRRKRVYDKMSDVFYAFICDVGLKDNEQFSRHMTSMKKGINAISELRNIITHGGDAVTETLASFCDEGRNPMFPYKVGDKISVNLFTLASTEYFFDSIISDINRELMVSLVGIER